LSVSSDTQTSLTRPLSLHDALPISSANSAVATAPNGPAVATPPDGHVPGNSQGGQAPRPGPGTGGPVPVPGQPNRGGGGGAPAADRKSTRLNSSHVKISYAVFCLKK